MDYPSFFSKIQMIVVLIAVILLTNICLKLLNKRLLNNNKIIKVIERTSVSNNSALGIVEVCGSYYLMSFTDKSNKILKELDSQGVELWIEEMENKQAFTDLKEKTNIYFGMRKKVEKEN